MSVEKIELGNNLRDISKWYWMSIFLFILIFPPIVLLVKYLKLIGSLKALGMADNEILLTEAGNKMKTAIILTIIPLGITQIIAFFMMIGVYSNLQRWGMQQNNMFLAEGFGKIKTGMILNIIPLGITQLIALFMIPGGFKKAGVALLTAASQSQPLMH